MTGLNSPPSQGPELGGRRTFPAGLSGNTLCTFIGEVCVSRARRMAEFRPTSFAIGRGYQRMRAQASNAEKRGIELPVERAEVPCPFIDRCPKCPLDAGRSRQ